MATTAAAAHPSLSDFVALSVIDDWLTGLFIDTRHGSLRTTKMAIGKEIRGPPAMRRAADAALAETAGVDAKAGRQRTKQLDGLAVRFLSHLVAPADRDRMAEYVHATLSRGRRGASALSFGTLSGTVPAGFTDQHVRLLVRYRPRRAKYVTAPRQTVLYLSMLHGQSAVEIRLTSRYGGAIQATVVARRAIAPDVLLGDLLGAAVDVSVQDEDLVRQSGREGWDFSILASLKKRGRAQLFLGPARFVNHDCQPNVKVRPPVPSLPLTIGA